MRRIVLSGLLGLLVTACGGTPPPPTPTVPPPTLPPLPTATFGPSPVAGSGVLIPVGTATSGSPSSPGERVVVINTEGDGANLRTDPSRSGQSIAIVPEGDSLEVIGPDRTADGITWRNVRDRLGNSGWMSAGFLGPPGSQSTVPTRAPVARTPQSTAAAKPAATATRPPATRAPATATRAAEAQPTSPAKPQAPAPAGLAVQANVSRPTIASGSQGLHVRVTNGGQPVAGARVVAVVQDPAGNKTLDLGSTDSSGVATRSFDVGTPRGTVTIAITVTTPDGRTISASTSYSGG